MRTVAILPVKSFGRAKQRLGDAVPDKPALAAAMVADVLDALARVPELDELIVVTAEPAAADAARAAGARVVHDPVEAGQSAAAALGIAARPTPTARCSSRATAPRSTRPKSRARCSDAGDA